MSALNRSFRVRMLAVAMGGALGLIAAEVGLRLAAEPQSEIDALAELAEAKQAPALASDCRLPAPQARLNEIVAPSSAPDVIYELRPGVETCFEGAAVRINSQGVREDSDLSMPKPPGTFRVLALGDSHAFGWGVEGADTVPSQLEGRLAARADAPVEVVNAGVPGYSAYQEAAWLAARGVDFEPDCVLVLFVANDMGLPHFLLRPREAGPSKLWDRIRTATASKRWFSFAPNELATFVSQPDMNRIPPRYRHMVGERGYRQAIEIMAELGRENGFEVVNVVDYSTLEVDSERLVPFQEDLGITVLDQPWPPNAAFRLSETDPHLNAEGTAAVAESIVAGLETRAVCLPPGRTSGRS